MTSSVIQFLMIYMIIMIVLQKLFALPQTNRIKKRIKEIKKLGICSVGVSRNIFGMKMYYIISADSEGNIIKGFKLNGMTVFSNFHEDTKLTERTVGEIMENKTNKEMTLIQRAKVDAAKNIHIALSEKTESAKSLLEPNF